MKKLLSTVLLLVVICITAGCNNNSAQEQHSSTPNATVSTANKELLLSEIENGIIMNGEHYPLPFSLDNLGEKYTLTGSGTEYDIYYNGEYYAYITTVNGTSNEISNISFTGNVDFKFGEIYIGNTKENIIKIYGEPDFNSPSNTLSHYIFGEKPSFMLEYSDDKIVSFSFAL